MDQGVPNRRQSNVLSEFGGEEIILCLGFDIVGLYVVRQRIS